MSEKETLLKEWREFEDKFKSGHGDWSPSPEEWIQQEQTGRRLLLAALKELPGVDPDRIAHCERYLEPFFWRASDFLERVIPIVAYRKEA